MNFRNTDTVQELCSCCGARYGYSLKLGFHPNYFRGVFVGFNIPIKLDLKGVQRTELTIGKDVLSIYESLPLSISNQTRESIQAEAAKKTQGLTDKDNGTTPSSISSVYLEGTLNSLQLLRGKGYSVPYALEDFGLVGFEVWWNRTQYIPGGNVLYTLGYAVLPRNKQNTTYEDYVAAYEKGLDEAKKKITGSPRLSFEEGDTHQILIVTKEQLMGGRLDSYLEKLEPSKILYQTPFAAMNWNYPEYREGRLITTVVEKL